MLLDVAEGHAQIASCFENETIRQGPEMATVTVRGIPDQLYKRLKKRAAENRRSINSEIIVCLQRYVQGTPVGPEAFLRRADALRERLALPPITEEFLHAAKYAGRR